MYTPLTGPEAVALGFVAVPDSKNKLYFHKRFPGVTYRIVASIEEALAMGGVAYCDSAYIMTYFGLDAQMAAGAATLGSIAIPETVVGAPLTGRFPSSRTRGATTVLGQIARSWRYDVNLWKAQTLVTTGKVIGVISAADHGFVYFPVAAVPPRHVLSFDVAFHTGETGWNPNAGTVGWFLHPAAARQLTCIVPAAGGYMYKRWTTNEKAYKDVAVRELLTLMSKEKAAVYKAYRDAACDEMHTISDSAMLEDGPWLSMNWDAVAEIMLATVGRRRPAVYQVLPVDSSRGVGPGDEVVRIKPGDPDYPTGAVNGGLRCVAMPDNRDGIVPGLFMPKVQLPASITTATSTFNVVAVSGVAALPAGSSTVPYTAEWRDTHPTFALDAVPFKDVILSDAQTVSAGAFMSFVGPGCRPSRAYPAERVIDYRSRFAEFDFLPVGGDNAMALDTNPTNAETAAARVALASSIGEGALDSLETNAMFAQGFVRDLLVFATRIDQRAMNKDVMEKPEHLLS